MISSKPHSSPWERIVRDSWSGELRIRDRGRDQGRIGLGDGVEAVDCGELVQGAEMTRVGIRESCLYARRDSDIVLPPTSPNMRTEWS